MNEQHLGDSIELYALGALDRDEARAVEAHAEGCAACAALLAQAERTITTLDALTVPRLEPPAELGRRIAASGRVVVPLRSRPSNVARWGALAAALLLGVVGVIGTREIAKDSATIGADDQALSAIAASHFSHTTFTKNVPQAPVAKVLWGKTPQWLYVIVDAPACNCHVVEIFPDGEHDLGSPIPRGNTATLFVSDAPRVTRVELRSDTQVLATARRP
jgi:hypothetical protein